MCPLPHGIARKASIPLLWLAVTNFPFKQVHWGHISLYIRVQSSPTPSPSGEHIAPFSVDFLCCALSVGCGPVAGCRPVVGLDSGPTWPYSPVQLFRRSKYVRAQNRIISEMPSEIQTSRPCRYLLLAGVGFGRRMSGVLATWQHLK